MDKARLPAEDLELIREHGVPLRPEVRYVRFHEDRSITLTERGQRLYRAASVLHGLSPAQVDQVNNFDTLQALTLKIKHIRLTYTHEVAVGGVDIAHARNIVNAMLESSAEQLQEMLEHRARCDAAGPTVVRVDFLNRRRAA